METNKRPESAMVMPHTSADTLNIMVHNICKETQLMESTVRDLLSAGYEYHESKWVKHRRVRIENYF